MKNRYLIDVTFGILVHLMYNINDENSHSVLQNVFHNILIHQHEQAPLRVNYTQGLRKFRCRLTAAQVMMTGRIKHDQLLINFRQVAKLSRQ